MTVAELIAELQKVEDQSRLVVFLDVWNNQNHDINNVSLEDDENLVQVF